MKKKWTEVIANAINAYRSGDYVYFYGAKDIVLTEANMDYLSKSEPKYFSRYSEDEIAQIKRNSISKRGIDCSGFVGWVCTGDKQYSTGQIANCSKYTSLKDGNTASILYTSWGGNGRHIGLDIGNGYTLQAAYESTDANIKAGRAGIILSKMTETAWEKSGESNCVDYTGAYSPYEPTTELIEEVFGHPDKPIPETLWIGECYGVAKAPVYSKPDIYSDSCEWPTLATGNLFEVVSEKKGFWGIRIASQYYGYIEKKYVLRKTPEFKGQVTTALNVRTNPGASYKSIGILSPGQIIDICDTKKAANQADWYYIKLKDGFGFCSARYVKKV